MTHSIDWSVATPVSREQLTSLAARFADDFAQHHHVFATAESCTGGLISATITDISGSSQWFDRAFVTYTNEAKMQMLQVSPATLQSYGAVSIPTACEMVRGALNNSNATIAVAVTGIAGPTGGSAQKPVGTVCIAVQKRGEEHAYACCHHFSGNREQVRFATVYAALADLLTVSSGQEPHGYQRV
ncbi:MAG: CinA family protein [Candidatus Anaerobiospirillum pullicola]|uniref:CinA family protein n=1 Tax=Candidatus Anaerobiospirillum pullicola TaxID=2838451 RepID=A0A948TFF4_9GAMM|nr:CinA family protein [Candidatus Anaerobiospirillum pullicola]